MSDPIPEGYLSLVEAWALYRQRCPGNPDPESFIAPFANDDLRAFVRMPGVTENFRLSPGSWTEQFFAERVFLSAEITLMPEDDPWGAFVGRTPFVSEDALHHWLARRAQTLLSELREQLQPAREPYWTLAMVVAWIAWRDAEAVRRVWPKWRAAIGSDQNPVSSASLTRLMLDEALAEDFDEAPRVATIRTAREDLWRQASIGAIEATAAGTDGPTVIGANEWPRLGLIGARDGTDELNTAGDLMSMPLYRDVLFPSDRVQQIWPAQRSRTSSRVNFDDFGEHITFGEAVFWIAAGGRQADTSVIAANFDSAVAKLVSLLAKGCLSVSGLNRQMLRETIDARYFERAAYEPGDGKPGHLLSIIDPTSTQPECGGTLTKYGERGPAWIDIQLSFADLRNALDAPTGVSALSTVRSRPTPYEQDEVDAYFNSLKNNYLHDGGPKVTWRGWRKKVAPARFPNISTTQADKAWDENAPQSWRAPGRPPNQSHSVKRSKASNAQGRGA